MEKQKIAFSTFFQNGIAFKTVLNDMILNDCFKKVKIESAIWKFYLFIFPSSNSISLSYEEWASILINKRLEYEKIKEKYLKQPAEDDFGPLFSINSEWNQYHKDQKLREKIFKDVDRLFQEENFFLVKKNKETIVEIIFLFLRSNPKYKYNQGYHELFGMIYYLFCLEMRVKDDDVDDKYFDLMFNQKYIDADAFWAFAGLIENVEILYQEPKSDYEPSFSLSKCSEIQNVLFKKYDPEAAMKMHSREDPIYMLQWLRLLFVRLFGIQESIPLWTKIFVFFPDLSLIYYIAVALLLSQRNTIVNLQNESELLEFIFHFTPPDPETIVNEALKLMLPGESKITENKNLLAPIVNEAEDLLNKIDDISMNSLISRLEKIRDMFSLIDESVIDSDLIELQSEDFNINIDPDEEIEPIIGSLPKAASSKSECDIAILTEERDDFQKNGNPIFHNKQNPNEIFGQN